MKFHIVLATAAFLAAAPAFAGECSVSNQTTAGLKIAGGGTEVSIAGGAQAKITEGQFMVKTQEGLSGSGACKAGQRVAIGVRDGKLMIKVE